MASSLLASAPTLEAITEAVARFYAGDVRTLEEEQPNVWTVHYKDGMQVFGVRVFKRGKRYRFETLL